MALEILTRFDEVRKAVVNHPGDETIVAGVWITRDVNGNAATPNVGGSGELVILGNEFGRPDSIGSETVTTQYGVNRYKVGPEGYEGTPGVGVALELGIDADVGLGKKVRAASGGFEVAVVEGYDGDQLIFKTLV